MRIDEAVKTAFGGQVPQTISTYDLPCEIVDELYGSVLRVYGQLLFMKGSRKNSWVRWIPTAWELASDQWTVRPIR